MNAATVAFAAYLVASLLFILSLAGLSKHETARNGVVYGVVGMAVALVATIGLVVDVSDGDDTGVLPLVLLVVAVVIGAAIGLWRARVVEMTGMPELIALLHSFVGLAAVLVGWNGYLEDGLPRSARLEDIHNAEVFVGVFIGARHLHRLDRGQPQAVGADEVGTAGAAGQERAQPRRARALRRAHGVVRRSRPTSACSSR